MDTVSIAFSSNSQRAGRERANGEATLIVAQFISLHGKPQLISLKEKWFNLEGLRGTICDAGGKRRGAALAERGPAARRSQVVPAPKGTQSHRRPPACSALHPSICSAHGGGSMPPTLPKQ